MTRLIVFTSAFAIATTAAMAGDSVVEIKSRKVESGSIITFSCADCPELKPGFEAPDVHGVEVIEHHVDGKKKIVQMDNMMGGSAVRIIKAGATPTENTNNTAEVNSRQQPVVAGSNVTLEGGGEFNVDEVAEDQTVEDGVDGGSQTSSVETINMNDAEHDNVGPKEPAAEEPHNAGPEIIELRTND